MLIILACSSCSDNDYLNAVPAESTMLISMDPAAMSGVGSQTALKALLHVNNLDKSGLDLSSKIVFFEDAQGNVGFCAKVDDDGQLAALLKENGVNVDKKRGFNFALLPSNWMLGFSDKACLLMGPIVPAAAAEATTIMANYLGADEKDGLLSSQMYERLDSIGSPMAMVTQAQALPEQFVAPFTLGAPRDADPSQVLIAAELRPEKGVLWIDGETFSFKRKVNTALREADKTYRSISGRYISSMSASDALGIFLNVDGSKFINLMRQDKGIQAMLAGINAAIDMDNIIKGVDGDMAIITPTMSQDNFQLTMAAKVKKVDWLADVDYWKQSVPEGGHIGDWGRDCYYYTNGKTTYYFGITPDMQYMSGGSAAAALQSVRPSKHPLPKAISDNIKGQKLVMVINMQAFGGDKASAITSMLRPMFGDVKTIVFRKK